MSDKALDTKHQRNERINYSINIYKWNLAWKPKVPLFVGIVSAVALATALQVLVAGTILGTFVVLLGYFLSVHEVNTQYERVISTFTETEEAFIANKLAKKNGVEVSETFVFTYENNDSPLGVKPSQRYRFNIVAVTDKSVCLSIGTDFDMADRKRMLPLSFDSADFANLDRVEATKVPSSGHIRFAVITNDGRTFDFETVEEHKAQDAAEAVKLAAKGKSPSKSTTTASDPAQPV